MFWINYTINGARFGRQYPRADWPRCRARIEALRAEGISVILKRRRPRGSGSHVPS